MYVRGWVMIKGCTCVVNVCVCIGGEGDIYRVPLSSTIRFLRSLQKGEKRMFSKQGKGGGRVKCQLTLHNDPSNLVPLELP